ncbi:MAG: hypothetical protein JW987_06145 [Anaerolineaceae bacterium]|nr:hypothetical protein [Anaerolineaceae bacterium]
MKKRAAVPLLSALLLTAGVLGAQTRGILPVYGQTGTLVPWAYLPLVARGEPGPSLSGCPMFPADNIWNHRVDTLPVHARSDEYVASIGTSDHLHPDFGSGEWNGAPIGIPYVVVPGTQPKFYVDFDYDDESDPGPYPIPPNPPIEGGYDRHILMVDKDNCKLYELFAAYYDPADGWQAGSGAIFDLHSNLLRPDEWTSADAAGLPILPGLVRYDEVASGVIRHAIRFTAFPTQGDYVWPARHEASSVTDLNVPPMGQRFRLKASFNISGYPAEVRVILQAFKDYGIILADNGSNWYISGVPDERWDNEILVDAFHGIDGINFEAVDSSGLMIDPDSGQARP